MAFREIFTLRCVVILLLLCSCSEGARDTYEEPDVGEERATSNQSTHSVDSTENLPGATDSTITSAEARSVLRNIYLPIQDFYQGIRSQTDGQNLPPEGMSTPEALQNELEETMAAEIAVSFTEQLLMPLNGRYIVRPTEKILTPFEDGPELQSVEVQNLNGRYMITERYAENELYGRVIRENIVRPENGQWKLIEIRNQTR